MEFLKLAPKKIQKASTEVIVRKNTGLSYGAFSDVFRKYRKNFGYYFFTEDDYVFCEDWFDSTLIGMLLENENPGYICGAVRDLYSLHAGNSVGVGYAEAFESIFVEHNKIPHAASNNVDPYAEDGAGQVLHTNSVYQKGFSLTDIGNRYTLYHVWPDGYEHFFPENSKEIIAPIQRII
jgi:hypothetical protein